MVQLRTCTEHRAGLLLAGYLAMMLNDALISFDIQVYRYTAVYVKMPYTLIHIIS